MEVLLVNFRMHRKTRKIYAVIGRYKDGKCECYCLNDDHHFECEKEFLLKKTLPIHWTKTEGFKDMLQRRYENQQINVGGFRWVTRID